MLVMTVVNDAWCLVDSVGRGWAPVFSVALHGRIVNDTVIASDIEGP